MIAWPLFLWSTVNSVSKNLKRDWGRTGLKRTIKFNWDFSPKLTTPWAWGALRQAPEHTQAPSQRDWQSEASSGFHTTVTSGKHPGNTRKWNEAVAEHAGKCQAVRDNSGVYEWQLCSPETVLAGLVSPWSFHSSAISSSPSALGSLGSGLNSDLFIPAKDLISPPPTNARREGEKQVKLQILPKENLAAPPKACYHSSKKLNLKLAPP